MSISRPADESTLWTTPDPVHGPTTRVRGAFNALAPRWPTALAIVSAPFLAAGSSSNATVGSLAEILIFLPLLYLVVSTLRRPALAWVALIGGIAVTSGLEALLRTDLTVVLLAIALAATVWGGAHGRFGDGSYFTVQVVGMVAFGALALFAMAVDPGASRYLVAAGWLAHGVWDFAHLWRDRVVARSYAEWCGVADVLVAAQLVLLPMLV